MRALLAVAFLLFAVGAQAQPQILTPIVVPLNGSTPVTSTGYDFSSNPALYSLSTTNRQFSAPFTLTFRIKTTLGSLGADTPFIDNHVGSTNGIMPMYNGTGEPGFPFQFQYLPGGGLFNSGCATRTCTRWSYINDGLWHDVVWVQGNATYPTYITGQTYIDGVLVDTQGIGSFTNSTRYWTIGLAKTALRMSEVRVYNFAFQPPNAQRLHAYYQAGLVPSAPDVLAANMVLYASLGNCTGTSPSFTCPDAEDGSNPFISDQTPPTVVLTAPTAGTYSGSLTLSGTCTDPAGLACASVAFTVDGYDAVFDTTSPFTGNTFDTTHLVDGTHVIGAIGTTLGGASASATTVTITTSNGITGNTYYVSDGTGTHACNDTNNGTSTTTPWCTVARVMTGPTGGTSTYGPGDKILFGGGENWSISGSVLGLILSSISATPNGFVSATVVNVGKTWGGANGAGTRNGVTVSNWDDGHGTACNLIAGTTSGCPIFNDTQTGAGNGYPFFGPYAVGAVNTHGTLFTNIRVLGSGTAAAPLQQSGIGIGGANNSGVGINEWYDNEVTNNEVYEVAIGIQVIGSGGPLQSTLVNNNLSHGATISSNMSWGIGNDAAARNSVLEGNLVYYIGGWPTHTVSGGYGGCCGNGVFSTNGASNPTHQFNVIHDSGANNNDCPGPVGDYFYATTNGVQQFDEVYNVTAVSLIAGAPCDNDGFDFDSSVTNALAQYNYSHDNGGTGMVGFMSQTWGPNVWRFNIMENDALGTGDFTGGVFGMGPGDSTAAYIAYNNTIAITKNGTTSYNGSQTRASGMGSACPQSGIFANNIVQMNSALGAAPFVFMNSGVANQTCPQVQFKANGYYATSGSGQWRYGSYSSITSLSSLATWQAFTPGGDTGAFNSNPLFSGTPPHGTCLTAPNGTGPQPCPSTYTLGTGSPALGTAYTGMTGAPWNQTITRDYYGNTCSGGNVHNIGASACQ